MANYIEQRDGYPANASDIYLCNGASDGIKTVIKLMMNTDPAKPSGIVSRGFGSALLLPEFSWKLRFFCSSLLVDDTCAAIPAV